MATGNNAAWMCICERAQPLLGRTVAGSGEGSEFVPLITEKAVVRCPDCGHIFVVLGDGNYGSVARVEELARERWPAALQFTTSKGGVKIFDDYRQNLIIDQDDPMFTKMRGRKLWHLRSENSEDALTWNVFRTLQHLPQESWLGALMRTAFPYQELPPLGAVTMNLWPKYSAPPSLLLAGYPEGPTEVDVCLETSEFVWFIEAKYRSDISLKTTHSPQRDQIVRNIDVGSHYAGSKKFFFSLLILDGEHSQEGKKRVEHYANSIGELGDHLPHRAGTVENVPGISLVTWAQLAELVRGLSGTFDFPEQQMRVRLLNWLGDKEIQ